VKPPFYLTEGKTKPPDSEGQLLYERRIEGMTSTRRRTTCKAPGPFSAQKEFKKSHDGPSPLRYSYREQRQTPILHFPRKDRVLYQKSKPLWLLVSGGPGRHHPSPRGRPRLYEKPLPGSSALYTVSLQPVEIGMYIELAFSFFPSFGHADDLSPFSSVIRNMPTGRFFLPGPAP